LKVVLGLMAVRPLKRHSKLFNVYEDIVFEAQRKSTKPLQNPRLQRKGDIQRLQKVHKRR
jgi:hypothetical protein